MSLPVLYEQESLSRPEDMARVIKALATLRGTTIAAMGERMKPRLAGSQLSKRMSGEIEWRARELEQVAQILRVPVRVLYLTPEEFAGSPWFHASPGQPALHVVPDTDEPRQLSLRLNRLTSVD